MSIKKWNEVSREVLFEKYGRGIERVDFTLPDGRVEDFYIRIEGQPICVVPLTEDNEVILVKQFRPGPQEIFLELPGGMIEEGESPEEAMRRELLEETGYVGDLQFVTRCYEDAYSPRNRYCFVAKNCKKFADQKLDANEFIEIILMPLAEFRNAMQKGQMTDTDVAYLGLDYLHLL